VEAVSATTDESSILARSVEGVDYVSMDESNIVANRVGERGLVNFLIR
jgi:hypothetical protein